MRVCSALSSLGFYLGQQEEDSLSPSDDMKLFFSSRSIRRVIELELIEAKIFPLEDNDQHHLFFLLLCLTG